MAKKKIIHTGFRVDRCRYGLLERIFAERWLHENNERRYTGGSILQCLFLRDSGLPWSLFSYRRPRLLINRRDAMVAATVIQWLGTNVGYCFLEDCIRRAGGRIEWPNGIRDQYYSKQDEGGFIIRDASAWYRFARERAFRKPDPIGDMILRRVRFESKLERRQALRNRVAEKNRLDRPRCQNKIHVRGSKGHKAFDYPCNETLIVASRKCPRCDRVEKPHDGTCRLCGELYKRHHKIEGHNFDYTYVDCEGTPVKLT